MQPLEQIGYQESRTPSEEKYSSPHHKAALYRCQALLRRTVGSDNQAMLSTAKDLAAKFNEAFPEGGATSNTVIAQACGISVQAVGQWRVTGRIHKRHLRTLADISGRSVSWWLGEDVSVDGKSTSVAERINALPAPFRMQLLGRLMELEGAVAAGKYQGLRSPNEYPQSHPFKQEADLWKQFQDPDSPLPAQSRPKQGGE